ncbi:MAG: hypothetical protein ACE5JP_13620 [Candidatus Bipolaricaulia bacterium]
MVSLRFNHKLIWISSFLIGAILLVGCARVRDTALTPEQIPSGIEQTVAFVDVTVIPMDREQVWEGQTVIVKDGRIAQMGPNATIDIPEDAFRVDGSGRFLLPGLSDMHVHLHEYENDLLLHLANGVTTVRELTGAPWHLKWRDEIARGERLGPNLWVYSAKIGSSRRIDRAGLDRQPHAVRLTRLSQFLGLRSALGVPSVLVDDPQKAEQVTANLVQQGYDGIKMGSYASQEVYRAVTVSAQQRGIPVIGHIPYSIWLDDFLSSEQEEAAHVEELFKILLDAFPDHYNLTSPEEVDAYFAGLEAWAFPETAQRVADADKWVTTTLAAMRGFAQQAYHITYTRDIAGVMVRGRWYTRTDLDRMLDEIAAAHEG